MVKEGRPRRGSLQFSPRKRARSLFPRVRSWPSGKGLLGFVGFKVGSLAAVVSPTNPASPFSGKKVVRAATVVEVPPLKLVALRFYRRTLYGSRVITETANLSQEVQADFARPIFEVQPGLAGLPMKHPATVELGFGGSLDDLLGFARENMDKDVRFEQFFQPNSFVDVTAVTKGRGLQGPVKRWGVAILSHKTEKSRRKPGSLGPWTPKRTPWQAPMAGQVGYHARTEYNKQILKLGSGDLNPKSGWHRYGLIRSDYVVLLGSIQGPPKRPVVIRKPHRPRKYHDELVELVFGKGGKK